MICTPLSLPAASEGDSGTWHLVALLDGAGNSFVHVDLAITDGLVSRLEPCVGACRPGTEPLVALPPLLNGHDHGRGTGTVAAGIPDQPLEQWLHNLDVDPPLSQHDLVGHAARAMLDSGIGAAVVCVNPQGSNVAAEVRAAADASLAAGIRAAIVYPVADLLTERAGRRRNATGWSADRVAAELAAFERICADYRQPTLEFQLGPVGPQWVSETALRAIADHSAAHRRRMHVHLLESPMQRRWADETYSEGLLRWLDEAGLLSDRTWLAHGTHLRDEELRLLAARGCGLTLNPSSNLRLASGLAPVDRADRHVPNLAVGLDGLSLNDDLDGWTELRLTRGIWQAQTNTAISGVRLLHLGTGRGRSALGSAAPQPLRLGARADLVLISVHGLAAALARKDWSLADVVVAAARPARVLETWIDGRRVGGVRAFGNGKGAR